MPDPLHLVLAVLAGIVVGAILGTGTADIGGYRPRKGPDNPEPPRGGTGVV